MHELPHMFGLELASTHDPPQQDCPAAQQSPLQETAPPPHDRHPVPVASQPFGQDIGGDGTHCPPPLQLPPPVVVPAEHVFAPQVTSGEG